MAELALSGDCHRRALESGAVEGQLRAHKWRADISSGCQFCKYFSKNEQPCAQERVIYSFISYCSHSRGTVHVVSPK